MEANFCSGQQEIPLPVYLTFPGAQTTGVRLLCGQINNNVGKGPPRLEGSPSKSAYHLYHEKKERVVISDSLLR